MQPIRVLYAEDYDLVLFTVKQLLELEGWHIDVFRDGLQAFEKLKSDQTYDVIILDQDLPRMDGLAILDYIRASAQHRHTPVIVFTAGDLEKESARAGANAFLRKPSGIRDLIPTIERLLYQTGDQLGVSETHGFDT